MHRIFYLLRALIPKNRLTLEPLPNYRMSIPAAIMDRLAKWAIPAGIAFTGISSSIYTGT